MIVMDHILLSKMKICESILIKPLKKKGNEGETLCIFLILLAKYYR